MICLTGDVHHMSLRTDDQAASDITEAESARRYSERCRLADVRATLYVTGRMVDEEWPALADWLGGAHLEIGGHTYHAFDPALPHRIWKKLTGNYNGPAFWERRDIAMTIDVIRERLGKTIKAWRNHCYFHGANTDRLLAEAGMTSCSDEVARPGARPRLDDDGLVTVPINVMPDHEHLYHADRTPESVERWVKRYRWSDAYGSASYTIDEWRRMVLEQIEDNERRGVVSVILAHPLCMYLADGFATLDAILERGRRYGSCTVSELIELSAGTTVRRAA